MSVLLTYQIESNWIKSNQIKLNSINSNQTKSNQIESNRIESKYRNGMDWGDNSTEREAYNISKR